jgi:hypothetical protein
MAALTSRCNTSLGPAWDLGKLDVISRRANHGSGQNNNDNMTLLLPELCCVHALSAISLVGPECDILRDIRCSLRDNKQDKPISKATCKLRRDRGQGTVRSAEWLESEGLMMFRGKVYVPEDREFRRRIVKQHHDTHIMGHPGRVKMLELVPCNYWWPQMSCYIGQYVKTCDLCC